MERITIIIVLLFYLLVVFNKDIIYLYRIKLVSLISFVGSFISSYSMFPYFGAILFFMPISQLLWLVPFFVYKDKVKSSDILVLSIISSFIYITISIVTTLVVGVSWFTK